MIALALGLTGCDAPPEDAPRTDVIHQGILDACSGVCGGSKPCSTGCSVTDSQGSYATTCGMYTNGSCDNRNGDWTFPKDPVPPPSGGGAYYEPFWCGDGPGPYEVVFWEDAGYQGRCVRRSAKYIGGGKYGDFFDRWIESPSGLNAFYNDKLSAVAVGSRVTLEIFNNADFGQSFGTWAPGKWISYVGNYANDKMSSYKIRVVK